MFALGNATFACSVCYAREQSFEEVCGETEVGRGLLAPEPCPLPPLHWHHGHAPSTQTEPQLEAETSADVVLPKTGNSCCYARYSCGNNSNIVVKLVQECKFLTHFITVLWKQFTTNDVS